MTLQRVDICGVCGGNGTLCAGCDGIPWSNTTVDRCGICGGGDLCVGCDGEYLLLQHFITALLTTHRCPQLWSYSVYLWYLWR